MQTEAPASLSVLRAFETQVREHRRFQRHGGVLKGGVLAVIATAIAVTEELGQVTQDRPDNRDLLARLPLPCPPL